MYNTSKYYNLRIDRHSSALNKVRGKNSHQSKDNSKPTKIKLLTRQKKYGNVQKLKSTATATRARKETRKVKNIITIIM